MRGGRFNYTPDATFTTDAVEKAAAEHREACETRLARIQNGKDPDYKNGTPWPEPRKDKPMKH